VTTIAVVAHKKKILGGGLSELRSTLSDAGFADPIWYEVASSREASARARKAVQAGADVLFVWGGDGTVQRCVDAVAGQRVDLAILPAGTANLLATNLGVPIDLQKAVDVGLRGARRPLDVGVLNGKRFAVMAGVGLDAVMMRSADGNLKDRFGRLAYVWTGIRASRIKPRVVSIKVDGKSWFKGEAVCILLGQMGKLGGGLVAFPEALPDDGLLEIGVITAEGAIELARVLGRLVVGNLEHSPFTEMTRGRTVDIRLDKATAYELDGGARKARRRLRASLEPGAITVCVPVEGES
jgi:diacylglycerol kinase (ATP)